MTDRSADGHLAGLYPELFAGRFTRVDGTVAFYVRVNALLRESRPDPVVLDYGAGRGLFLDDPVTFRRELRQLNRVARVVGVDIDEAVLRNPSLDEAHVIKRGDPLPLDASSVDLLVSDFTFEHIANPAEIVGEFSRVLRPGGWLCARTPNKKGLIGVGARLVPNNMHVSFLGRLQPDKRPEDTFPTTYQLNSPKQIRAWFGPMGFGGVILTSDSEPRYVGKSRVAALAAKSFAVVTPRPFRSMLTIFLQKPSGVPFSEIVAQ